MIQTFELQHISQTAQSLAKLIENNIILVNGPMGAGKTTLIKSICHVLNVQDIVSSPTFSLVNHYLTQSGKNLYHFDCYRIETAQDALDFGAEEYLYSGDLCFIEWAENIQELIPSNHHVINLKVVDHITRKLTFI